MKSARKNLSLNVEYSTTKELAYILRMVADQVSSGKKYERELFNGSIYEYAVESAEPVEYREEFINDQWVQVFQSKMNKNES